MNKAIFWGAAALFSHFCVALPFYIWYNCSAERWYFIPIFSFSVVWGVIGALVFVAMLMDILDADV